MDRLISIQAAIDVVHRSIFGFFEICDDNSEEPISEKDKLLLDVNKAICNGIKAQPSAQPEIIRCKDCICYDAYVDGIEKYQWDGFCSKWARNTYEDWYCSRADMRGEQHGKTKELSELRRPI